MTVRIGIIGTGPAGLVMALALEKYTSDSHTSITVMDRGHDTADHPGVEYGIQSRASRALDRLGLRDAARAFGHPGTGIVLHTMRTNSDQRRIPFDAKNTFGVLRSEFLTTLTHLLRRSVILRGHTVADLTPLDAGRVRVDFGETRDTTPPPLEFDIVLACDGVNSVARQRYFPNAVSYDRGFSIIYLLVTGDPAEPRTPELFPTIANRGDSELIMGRIVTAALFPQGRDRLTIALGFDHSTRERMWREHGRAPGERWTDIPVDAKASIAASLARDVPVHGGLIEGSLALVSDWNSPQVYQWLMRDSDPLSRPFAPDCNIALVGDACHAFLPTIGMGASLAIEDAEKLGARLGRYLTAHAGKPISQLDLRGAVFEPFARERIGVWHDLMGRARAATRNWMNQDQQQMFDMAPYIPGAVGSSLMGVVEKAKRRLTRRSRMD